MASPTSYLLAMADLEPLNKLGLYLTAQTLTTKPPRPAVPNPLKASLDKQVLFYFAQEIIDANVGQYMLSGRIPWVDIDDGKLDEYLDNGEVISSPHIFLSFDSTPQDQDEVDQSGSTLWGFAQLRIECLSNKTSRFLDMSNEAEIMRQYAVEAITEGLGQPTLGIMTVPNLQSWEKVTPYPYRNNAFCIAPATLKFFRPNKNMQPQP